MTTLKLRTELERLRERLLDLSTRNPLLNYRKSKRRTLQIIDELPNLIHARLVVQGKTFRLAFTPEPPRSFPIGSGCVQGQARDQDVEHSDRFPTGPQGPPETSSSEPRNDDPISDDGESPVSFAQTSDDAGSAGESLDLLQEYSLQTVSSRSLLDAEAEGEPCELPNAPEHQNAASKHLFDDQLQTNLNREQLESQVRSIRREAITAIQETGINYLHLALGFLSWRESEHSESERLAPLVLIPIQIETITDGRTGEPRFEVRWTEDDINGNPTLLKKLQRDFGIQLPDYEIDTDLEDYFTAVSERTARMDHWNVKREALIGFFSFYKLSMYQDLAPEQWPQGSDDSKASLVEQLICGTEGSPADDIGLYARDYWIDEHVVANEILLPMDVDSSQHSALCDIREGKNLVIEGPPGTGKSQTISNAIADAIASGKTVLFVAEKLTALQVVHDRLESLGLGDFCLELHSDSASPRHVYESLHKRLAATYSTPVELQTYRDGLVQLRRRLNRYVDEMGRTVGPNSEPLYDLIWKVVSLRSQGAIDLPKMNLHGTLRNATEFQQAIAALDNFAAKLRATPDPRENPWWGFFTDPLAFHSYPRIDEILNQLRTHLDRFRSLADRFESSTSIPRNSLLQIAKRLAASRLRELADTAPQDAFHRFRKLASPSILKQTRQLLDLIEQQTAAIGSFDNRYSIRYDAVAESYQTLKEIVEALGDSQLTAPEILRAVDDWRANAQVPARPASLPDDVTVRLHPKPNYGTISLADTQGTNFPFFDLFKTIAWCKQAIQSVHGLLEVRKSIQLPGNESFTNFVDFQRMLKILQLIHHPAVRNADDLTQQQFSNEGKRAYRDAKEKSDQLSRTRESLEKLFHIPSAPSGDSVGELARTLRRYHSSWFRWLNREYRLAIAKIQEFATLGSRRSITQRIGDLEALSSFLHECREFADDARFRETLGGLFQGVKTNWEMLKTIFDWVHTIQRYNIDYRRCLQLVHERDRLTRDASLTKLGQLNDLFESLFLIESPDRPQGIVLKQPSEIPLEQLRSDAAGLSEIVEHSIDSIRENAEQLGQLLVTCEIASRSLEELSKITEDLQALGQLQARIHSPQEWQALIDLGIHPAALFDIDAIASACRWFYELEDAFKGLPEDLLSKLVELDHPTAYLRDMWENASMLCDTHVSLLTLIDTLGQYAQTTTEWIDLSDVSLLDGSLQLRIDRMSDCIEQLPAWSAFSQTLHECRQLGLGDYCDAAIEGQVAGDLLSACFQLTEFQSIAETAFRSSSILPKTTGVSLDALRREFQAFDRKLRDLNRNEIAVRAAQRKVPIGNGRGRVGELTELSLIRHETQKQRRHCRIRDLIQRAGTATQALKPCFMMSPLSVSRFIPQDTIKFDMVIMDEASQIKPEDAIGTILRGKQLVVVGDPKQLPPTSFFDRIDEDVEDDESTLIDNTESILEASMKVFQPFRRLRWHYRSQHESLIRFSNFNFYDNDLVVFPSNTGDNGKTGVTSVYVEKATFTGGTNVREAEAIVDAIVHHAITSPGESLGIGAFNKKQAELIYDLLEKRCGEDPRARIAVDRINDNEEELFIKNLENVQGDERDVILVGYTYGPDPASGRLLQRFGPINAEKGWRRLNVLITRSRKRMVVFHSFMPNDVLGGPDKSRGVNAYKDFLSYAMSGRLEEQGSVSGRQPHSPFEVAVCRTIEAMGLEAVPQVGVAGFYIDIGVRRREGDRSFILGVECDGATYHSALSARDRDRLRQEIIESRGWNIYRIWSTDWFLNQAQEEERLRRAIRNSLDS